MAFKSFTLKDLRTKFGIQNGLFDLFGEMNIAPITPSKLLNLQLEKASNLPLKSEKARSEFFVAPVLLELRGLTNEFFTIHSGETLVADPERGLVGECDFILAKSDKNPSYDIHMPILSIVEAKRDNLEFGIQQCAAQLYGAYLFNQSLGTDLEKIYGCVTTADRWQFLEYSNKTVRIDRKVYFQNELHQVLGIFKHILDYYKDLLKD